MQRVSRRRRAWMWIALLSACGAPFADARAEERTALVAIMSVGSGIPADSSAAGSHADASRARSYWLSYDARGKSKYLEWLWKDGINLYTRPYFWRGAEWRRFGLEAGLTGAVMPADQLVRDAVMRNRQASLSDALEAVNDAYGSMRLASVGAGVFLVGLAARDERLADTGFLSAESVFYAGQLAAITKFVFGRERPAYARDQWEFRGWDRRRHSFVSEDAILAFAFSSSVSEVWRTRWVSGPAYGLAIAVAVARVDRNAHWLSDVVGSGFLGTAVGRSMVRIHRPRAAGGAWQVGILPGGLGVTGRF